MVIENKKIVVSKDDIYDLMFLEFMACFLWFVMFMTAKIARDFPGLRELFIIVEFKYFIDILYDIKQWFDDAEVA